MPLSRKTVAFIRAARLAHLATADAKGQPHVIPICFVFDGKEFYSPIDEKPKRTAPMKLKRFEISPKIRTYPWSLIATTKIGVSSLTF